MFKVKGVYTLKLIITGGSGFIGTYLSQALVKLGHEVIVIGSHLPKNPKKEIRYIQSNLLEGEIPLVFAECDGIIHLAGANIFHHWTKKYKQLLKDSRIKTAQAIYYFLAKQPTKPKFFISASAIGFYGNRGDEILDEKSSPGSDFLASLCLEWEQAHALLASLGMRTASIRTGIVLSAKGGALSKMLPLFRWGLGGKLGSGSQWFSWIHIEDLINVYLQAISDPKMTGPINAVAPQPIRNSTFTQELGSILKKPTPLPIPAWILRMILGEFGTTLTAGQRVVPHFLENLGFHFSYPTIQDALRQEIGQFDKL